LTLDPDTTNNFSSPKNFLRCSPIGTPRASFLRGDLNQKTCPSPVVTSPFLNTSPPTSPLPDLSVFSGLFGEVYPSKLLSAFWPPALSYLCQVGGGRDSFRLGLHVSPSANAKLLKELINFVLNVWLPVLHIGCPRRVDLFLLFTALGGTQEIR